MSWSLPFALAITFAVSALPFSVALPIGTLALTIVPIILALPIVLIVLALAVAALLVTTNLPFAVTTFPVATLAFTVVVPALALAAVMTAFTGEASHLNFPIVLFNFAPPFALAVTTFAAPAETVVLVEVVLVVFDGGIVVVLWEASC